MGITVSVIIPVYKYLDKIARCLDSLVAQKYKNFEVILVCHSSTYEEVYRIAQRYNLNSKVIKVEKDGISICRNVGIANSKGRYIAFVDSDDYVLDRYLEVLLGEMGKDVPLAMCNYMQKIENETDIHFYKLANKEYTIEELINNMYGEVPQYNGFLWNKLFDAQIIKEKNIKFDEEVSLNEDRLFIITYLLALEKNSKIKYNADTQYCYIQHPKSITTRLERGELEKEKAMSEIVSFVKCEKMLEGYENVIDKLVRECVERSIRILRLLKRNTTESKRIGKNLKRLRKQYSYLFTRKRRLQMFLYEHYLLRTLLILIRRRTY